MLIRLLGPDTYREMPWRNGLGVTTEIARRPATGESFDWRVSMASVASDGPFSSFADYDRIIVALTGAGMVLRHLDQATPAILAPLEAYAFSGDWQTHCTLRGGAIRDFNVIVRRSALRAVLTIARPVSGGPPLALPAPLALLYCVAGNLCVASPSQRITCAAGETLEIERTSPSELALEVAEVAAGTVLLQVLLHPISG